MTIDFMETNHDEYLDLWIKITFTISKENITLLVWNGEIILVLKLQVQLWSYWSQWDLLFVCNIGVK